MRQYSLGMRQRLGLAHALLGDPEVLILDEPANGLDPDGMRWMRGLLRDFADRGGTVLLSSHLLHEVAGDRRPARDHRRRPDRRRRAPATSCWPAPARSSSPPTTRRWPSRCATRGLARRPAGDGGFVVDAVPEAVGRAALDGGVALTHLGPVRGRGPRELFFELTAEEAA